MFAKSTSRLCNRRYPRDSYTQVPRKHHAEADALKQIQGKAFNFLKMYVTFEPCSFHGRTPACALAIAEVRFNKILVAIAAVTALPSTILDANVTTVTTFISKDVYKQSS